jgi:hypothetical protein
VTKRHMLIRPLAVRSLSQESKSVGPSWSPYMKRLPTGFNCQSMPARMPVGLVGRLDLWQCATIVCNAGG